MNIIAGYNNINNLRIEIVLSTYMCDGYKFINKDIVEHDMFYKDEDDCDESSFILFRRVIESNDLYAFITEIKVIINMLDAISDRGRFILDVSNVSFTYDKMDMLMRYEKFKKLVRCLNGYK